MATILRLTASEISGSIMYALNLNAFPNSFLMKAIQRGQLAHSRNGYNNTKMYSRFYKGIEIVGIPDRVDNYHCYEFKTYSSPATKIKNEKVGTIQIIIYEFLTGLKGELILYDIHKDQVTDTLVIPFSQKRFRNIILQAIKLKQMKLDFLEKYKNTQKSAKDIIFTK